MAGYISRNEVTTVATESVLPLGRGPGSSWVRALPPPAFPDDAETLIPAPPAPPALSRPPKRATGPRFVEACRFDASQRATLLTTLEAEGLGDADSRQIFLAALEYDLASCRPLLGERIPPGGGQPSPSPETIGATAMSMATGPAATQPSPLVPPVSPALDLKAPALTGLAPTPPPSPNTPDFVALPPPSAAAPESAPLTSPSSVTAESALPEPPLLALAHLATELAQAITDLSPAQRETLKRALEASDCLARGYGDRYLDTLRLEMLHLKAAFSAPGLEPGMAAGTASSPSIDHRLATATSVSPCLESPEVTAVSAYSCITPQEATEPPALMSVPPPSPPPVPPEVRRLLQRAADAYADCFEGDPSHAAAASFSRILRVLGDVTGLPLPKDEKILREMLVSGP